MMLKNGVCSVKDDWLRPDKASRCTYQLGMSLEESPHHHHHRLGKFGKPKILPDILSHIHDTPLVKLNKIPQLENIKCQMFAKCEFFNPGGSIKDRIALKMVEDAEKSGRLKPGCTIIEPTSGNTGIGLAMVSAVKGYKCIIVLSEKMSKEKVDVLKALGAEIVRTPTSAAFDHPDSNIRVAEKMVKEMPNAVLLNQHTNSGNPVVHYDHTAEEILEAFDDKLDMVVCGAGTGGTITGLARKIKERCPTCKVIGVDPIGSILAIPNDLNVEEGKYYEVEGLGYDFKPTVLEHSFVDKWYKSEDKPSFTMARMLIREEGLLCGGSSGSTMYCAIKAAKDFNLGPDQKVVVIMADSIRNYMTKFVNDDWLKARSLYEGHEKCDNQKWKSDKISVLSMWKVKLLSPETKVRCVVEILKAENLDFAVVASDSMILGTVNTKILMESVIKGSLDLPVSKVANRRYRTLNMSNTLDNLCTLLDTEHSVLIIVDLRKDKSPGCIVGYVKSLHVASYLCHSKFQCQQQQ